MLQLKRRPAIALAALCMLAPLSALADYPSRPLTFIVNFPAGGASDRMARIFGQALAEELRQTVVIENKPGAAGAIGMVAAARAEPDGYTFTLGALSTSITQPLITKTPYDMKRDFTPISLIALAPSVLVVPAASPFKTVDDIVAAAKAAPGKLNFGSGGIGTFAQLTGEMLNQVAGIQTTHIPYKGGGEALKDVIANRIDMITLEPPNAMPQLRAGTLRAIAYTGARRSPLLPDVPTFIESGYKDLVGTNSWAVYMPAGVPGAVVETFHKALVKAMENPRLVAQFAELGAEAVHTTPGELREFVAAETARYAAIIKKAKIHAD
ncbi:MAG: tripartite tricarboxylate transporter substrate binding protein [Pigmentiphaga sp.]|uniref:Bug family tripartite tricarboxylate transporter substrate binding protein n=1 Tax=Pigmentiphaga sp. TaxID=1977564 RepID=UPI0029A61294|nr:tripartite tricarboxylate transporter substrate binding protein [Pigmentiphaga sp.]MDX3907432.1 tripartite tricarboxylate transporter substrate binding protein [Pigmentiphaga sp.]